MDEDKQIPYSPEEFDEFILGMKQELEFLRSREQKLNRIEQMFESGRVDLDKLTMIVKGEK